MEIRCFDRIDSTQRYLCDAIRRGSITAPAAVIAEEQTAGIGSRDNRWLGVRGNFFASVALEEEKLPADLPLSSGSIYFAWLMKDTLQSLGSELWIKWPNDLYTERGKVGGVLTQKIGRVFVVGLGVNLKKGPKNFPALGMELPPMILLDMYLERLEKAPKWKDIFIKYRLEFERSRGSTAHIDGREISLRDAELCEDGSLIIDGKRMVSYR